MPGHSVFKAAAAAAACVLASPVRAQEPAPTPQLTPLPDWSLQLEAIYGFVPNLKNLKSVTFVRGGAAQGGRIELDRRLSDSIDLVVAVTAMQGAIALNFDETGAVKKAIPASLSFDAPKLSNLESFVFDRVFQPALPADLSTRGLTTGILDGSPWRLPVLSYPTVANLAITYLAPQIDALAARKLPAPVAKQIETYADAPATILPALHHELAKADQAIDHLQAKAAGELTRLPASPYGALAAADLEPAAAEARHLVGFASRELTKFEQARLALGSITLHPSPQMASFLQMLNALPDAHYDAQAILTQGLRTGKFNLTIPDAWRDDLAQRYGHIAATFGDRQIAAAVGVKIAPIPAFRALSFTLTGGVAYADLSLSYDEPALTFTDQTVRQALNPTATGLAALALSRVDLGKVISIPSIGMVAHRVDFTGVGPAVTFETRLDLARAARDFGVRALPANLTATIGAGVMGELYRPIGLDSTTRKLLPAWGVPHATANFSAGVGLKF